MRKRLFAGALSVALIGAIALPVAAEGNSNSMTVKYEKAATYTLTIPSTITLSADGTPTSAEISVSNVNTKPKEKVQVKISGGLVSGNKVELVRTGDADTKVFSLITMDENVQVTVDTVILGAEGIVENASKNIFFSAIQDSADGTVKAGSYEGTLTFSASYVSETGE